MKLINTEQEAEIVRRYQAGEGSTVLARAFNVSVSTICNTLTRCSVQLRSKGGAPGRGRARSLNAEQEAAIIASYGEGQTLRELATEYGVHAQTIQSMLERCGVEVHKLTGGPHRVLTPAQETEIVDKLQAGACGRELADTYGVSPSSISNIWRRAGMPMAKTGQKLLTSAEEDQIVARYLNGESALAISQDFTVHADTVRNVLKRRGVPVRPDLAKPRLAGDKRELIAEACSNGMSVPDAAKKYRTSESTVTRILRQHQVKMRIGKPRTYELNEAAFDALTPESCYWAGFLLADGCVSKDDYLICMLAEKDRAHLEKLRAFLGSTHPIFSVSKGSSLGGPFVRFSVRSTRYANALKHYWNGRFKPDCVPCAEMRNSRDFWRGLLDGDGSLGHDGRYPHICFNGSAPVMDEVSIFIKEAGITSLNRTTTSSGIFRIETSGSTALAIIRTLYAGASVVLDRKNARAQAILNGSTAKSAPYDEGPASVAFDDADALVITDD